MLLAARWRTYETYERMYFNMHCATICCQHCFMTHLFAIFYHSLLARYSNFFAVATAPAPGSEVFSLEHRYRE